MAEAEGQFLQKFGKDLLLSQNIFRNGESEKVTWYTDMCT